MAIESKARRAYFFAAILLVLAVINASVTRSALRWWFAGVLVILAIALIAVGVSRQRRERPRA
jgi:FtsH-binding integral membrane protein